MASIKTRWRSIWPSSACGWPRWPKTILSRSWITPCAAAIRWSDCRAQIAGFHWDDAEIRKSTAGSQARLLGDPIAQSVERATAYRRQILAARDDNPYDDLQQKLAVADDALALAQLVGDLVISVYFSASKDRDRKTRLDELSRQLLAYVESQNVALRATLADAVAELRGSLSLRERAGVRAAGPAIGSPFPITPFHWRIEFPEIFARPNAGFDCIVGNPPFMGKNTLIAGNRAGYLDWLKTLHDESHGNAERLTAAAAFKPRRASRKKKPGDGTQGEFLE